MTHKALIGFHSVGKDLKGGLEESLVLIKEYGEIKKVSSVFRVLSEARGLNIVILVELRRPYDELRTLFSELSQTLDVEGVLLLVDDIVELRPSLPLPNPNFHLWPHWIIPSSELWPDAIHPVLKKSLTEIVSQLDQRPWGEFVAQGKTLLDFSH